MIIGLFAFWGFLLAAVILVAIISSLSWPGLIGMILFAAYVHFWMWPRLTNPRYR